MTENISQKFQNNRQRVAETTQSKRFTQTQETNTNLVEFGQRPQQRRFTRV